MKRIVTLLLILISTYDSFAQVTNHSFITEGNFLFSRRTNDITRSGGTGTQNVTNLQVGGGGGYAFSQNFIVGFIIEYERDKTKEELELPVLSPIGGRPVSFNQSEVRRLRLAPAIFVKYQRDIAERFNAGLRFSTAYNLEGTRVISLNGNNSSLSSNDNKFALKYPSFQLTPELQYFITSHFGFGVRVGGLYYASYKQESFGDKRKNENITLNLNPSQWQWGLVYILK